MATAKFKMPTDKQIGAEVDQHLVNLTEGYKQVKGVPECRGVDVLWTQRLCDMLGS